MSFIFGVATQEADLYKIFRDFVSGRGRAGKVVLAGTGNGKLNNLILPEGNDSLYETFTLTCVSTSVRGGTFGVVGSVSGTLPDAVVGTVYKHAKVEFYIDFGTVDYALGDTFTITGVNKPVAKPGFSYYRGGVQTASETVTLTCTTAGRQYIPGVQAYIPAVFSVVGSVTGAMPDLTQGTAYVNPAMRALLADDTTSVNQYALADVITVDTTRNPLREVNQHWEILRQTAAVGADTTQFGVAVVDTDTELVLRGPGLSNTDSVYWGMTRAWDTSAAAAWWTHFGITGYIPTVSMVEQPTVQGGQAGPRPIHTMWSLNIPYVIIANGRRFIMVTRSNIYYSSSYAGLYLPSTMPKYLGYPYAVGGTGDTRDTMWSSLSANRAAFWDYLGDTSGGSLYTLDESVSWVKIYGSNNGNARVSDNRTTPYGNAGVYDLRANLDGTVPAFQVQLQPNRGFLDGVFAIPGRDGRQPEEILMMRDGTRCLVTQNHHQSGFSNFCAFTLE